MRKSVLTVSLKSKVMSITHKRCYIVALEDHTRVPHTRLPVRSCLSLRQLQLFILILQHFCGFRLEDLSGSIRLTL